MSRPTSYFDRDVKLKTPEAMFKRLEAITGQPIPQAGAPSPQGGSVVSAASQQTATADGGALPVEPRATARSSPRDRQPLQWHAPITTPDGGHIRSLCGLYTVTKSRSMGKWVYTASYQRSPLQGAVTSADEAKQIAQEHADSATGNEP